MTTDKTPIESSGVDVRAALARVYGFELWTFENECEFKHEPFHQLAQQCVAGVPSSEKAPGALTCRLHAEGKIENGNPSKADLLICDPHQRQARLNYPVDHLIELKRKLTTKELTEELKKFSRYARDCASVYFIAERGPLLRISSAALPSRL
jgi:hypothetical protein